MERKIGEIFEYNGGWYQAVEQTEKSCKACYFYSDEGCFVSTGLGWCRHYSRNDNKSVIFKKLEKVGEMYEKRVSDSTSSTFQRYRVYNSVILPKEPYIYCNFIDSTVEIEIKQNKEEMKDKKLNLKPFDLQKAREGKPVCTRDGRKARIICFDRRFFYNNVSYPILALVECPDGEDDICGYTEKGKVLIKEGAEHKDDLMMLPEKKEGWVNVYKRENEYVCENECNVSTGIAVYKSEGEAKRNIDKNEIYVNTIKISWEE